MITTTREEFARIRDEVAEGSGQRVRVTLDDVGTACSIVAHSPLFRSLMEREADAVFSHPRFLVRAIDVGADCLEIEPGAIVPLPRPIVRYLQQERTTEIDMETLNLLAAEGYELCLRETIPSTLNIRTLRYTFKRVEQW